MAEDYKLVGDGLDKDYQNGSHKTYEKDVKYLPDQQKEIRRSLNLNVNVNNIQISSNVEKVQRTGVEEYFPDSYKFTDELKKFSSSPDFKPGSAEHLKICLSIVEKNLWAESDHHRSLEENKIICDVNLYNIQFNIQEEYVFIDYETLLRSVNPEEMKELSTLFHVVLIGISEAGTDIYESDVYSFLKKSESNKLGLKFRDENWLIFLKEVYFPSLGPAFKLIFKLHCMTLAPNKCKETSRILASINPPAKGADSLVTLTEIGRLEFFQSDIVHRNIDDGVKTQIILPQNCPFVGDVQLTASLSFYVRSKFQGRLKIFMKIRGVGYWKFRDCKVTCQFIVGGRLSETTKEIEDIDVEIPFNLFEGPASLCDFQVCEKPNSFSVLLKKPCMRKRFCVNRELLTDGEIEYRFLAEAESQEDANKWCDRINVSYKSFMKWAKHTPLI